MSAYATPADLRLDAKTMATTQRRVREFHGCGCLDCIRSWWWSPTGHRGHAAEGQVGDGIFADARERVIAIRDERS